MSERKRLDIRQARVSLSRLQSEIYDLLLDDARFVAGEFVLPNHRFLKTVGRVRDVADESRNKPGSTR